MKISECPYCGGQIGAIEYDGAADPGDRLERTDRGIPQVPEGYEDVMRSIPPEVVVSKIQQLLNNS